MTPPVQPGHLHGPHGISFDARAARLTASWTHGPSTESRLGCLPGQRAVQQLFRRWPFVPSRELERIRRVLLHCDEIAHPATTRSLSEPAHTLLDLVTAELERRREPGHHQPLNQGQAAADCPDIGQHTIVEEFSDGRTLELFTDNRGDFHVLSLPKPAAGEPT
ncbi:hypothetical protein [Arthrobacter bambusae]|uniref:Uncharacterized protein n=1 Tax=Arthrobacter bambusae TaxID=1338426 RepID=A0AAW8DEK0_9MICC|nr:hypothetical protein [Arthrobacter bambusae]MDP9903093.1 hypothetical protein [Arthrobacter bambusae]MDQ0128913.1 hypothetical protein [Arthrobacter bambusae]MDQ0180254.1 hypothetical protein [Arthrobacter bambusae]